MSSVLPFLPCLVRSSGSVPSLGDPVLDEYLRFTAARVRPNTLTAQSFDLKVFFSIVAKPPLQVQVGDVLAFIEAQRSPRRGENVVRLADGEAGLAASTIKRRLATISSLYDYLVLRGHCDRNPVPRSMGARGQRAAGSGAGGRRGAPLIRTQRKLPRVLAPAEVVALTSALRTERDRAMVALMVHGGLRRCEVLGLRFEDVHVGDRRVFIAEGKGGHQRLVPVADAFFTALAAYLSRERPQEVGHDRVFVVLKGPTVAVRSPPRVWTRSWLVPDHVPGCPMRPVMNFVTPVSPGYVRVAWHWRRSRLKPGTPRSKPPACTCICRMTGSLPSTAKPWTSSMPGTRTPDEHHRRH